MGFLSTGNGPGLLKPKWVPFPSTGSNRTEYVPRHRQALSIQPTSSTFTGTPIPPHSTYGDMKDAKGLILLLFSS